HNSDDAFAPEVLALVILGCLPMRRSCAENLCKLRLRVALRLQGFWSRLLVLNNLLGGERNGSVVPIILKSLGNLLGRQSTLRQTGDEVQFATTAQALACQIGG